MLKMNKNAFISDMKPLIIITKCLGWFPARVVDTKKHVYFEVKLLSWQFLYSMIAVTFHLGISLHVLKKGINTVTEVISSDFHIFSYISCFRRITSLLLPLLSVIQIQTQVQLFNSWSQLQYQIETSAVSGKPLKLNLKRAGIINVFILTAILSIMFIMRTIRFSSSSLIDHILVTLTFVNETMIYSWWYFSCKALRITSSRLLQEFHLLLEYNEAGKSAALLTEVVFGLRVPWLKLCNMVQMSGFTFSLALSYTIICMFSRLLTTAYVVCVIWDLRVINYFGLLFVLSTVTLNIMCQATHNLQQAIHQDLILALGSTRKLRITNKSQYTMLNFFMHLIQHNPEITFSGYINAGRPLLATLISSFITYIIVILQFQSNAKGLTFDQFVKINNAIFD